MNKKELRAQLQDRVTAMSSDQKRIESEAICTQLMSIASILNANSIFTYLPLANEVTLLPLMSLWIDESRTVSVPLINWDEKTMQSGLLTSLDANALIEGRYGMKEPREKHPIPSDSIDVVLVPGLGFDASGGRLGRGGGFYDKFLAIARPPIVIGICFQEQLIDRVPTDSHDQLMCAVVTPTNVLVG